VRDARVSTGQRSVPPQSPRPVCASARPRVHAPLVCPSVAPPMACRGGTAAVPVDTSPDDNSLARRSLGVAWERGRLARPRRLWERGRLVRPGARWDERLTDGDAPALRGWRTRAADAGADETSALPEPTGTGETSAR